MKRVFLIVVICTINVLAGSNPNNQWKKFDFNISQKKIKTPEYNINFKDSFSSLLSNVLENKNGIDKTWDDLNFNNGNVKIKNLNSLYEYKNISLLFQKELYVSEDNYNYSGGLINRYKQDNFLIGVNSFIDRKKEQKDVSFGGEFGYSNFLKAYTNYYYFDQAKRNIQLGVSFTIPNYDYFYFDINKNEENIDYKVSYSPYSIFNLNFIFRELDQSEDRILQLGFKIDLNKSFFKQLKKNNDIFEEVQRYDFLKR
ncbi:inverse autotransporter beta domain-containing protein [Campylobacter sp. TTU-622]|uniref:inverse autotransporter beta domain-containing protein n=1 Tax=unclassified Campylobacter TaxID=2593542 RepID=UPI0019084534|nr:MULTISPECIES: inverse autotransporter beta domain-containing protein [unclassified Campylobacter]MBK1971705.1 inverse autotransporter beta domain-containing protein [Campylobacter sp. TTU_617]MBK1972951.1 inverse autotransporter beta domain-containing protein [Campylobacter sp. TTU-622]MBK1991653.1 inverse autotransporter beta domain-containing protein [Campylobacter sp. 2018MI34]